MIDRNKAKAVEPYGLGVDPASSSVASAADSTGQHTAETQLGKRAARGASVVLIGQISRIAVQIGSVSILARLLDPVDYGLVAIVLAVVGVGEILRDSGLSTAAVQAKTLDRNQRDKLFWVNGAIGLALCAVGIAIAPAVSALFGQPQLTAITRVLSVTFVLNGLIAQFRAGLNRSMKFGSLVVSDMAAQLIGVAVAVLLAWNGAAYWALVGQQLTQALATLIIVAIWSRWLPRWPRKGTDIRSMLKFGHGLMATQLIGYVNSNVDTYTIGLAFGPVQLGVYNRAYQLLMRPLSQMRSPTTTVALPVLSKLQDDPVRAGQYIVRGQLALGYSLVAGLSFAAGAAEPMVQFFLGSNWAQVGPIFAVLAIAGMFQTLSYVGNWVYLARGLTGQLFYYSLISLAIKVICVLVGSRWGVFGVAVGFAVAPGIAWPISLWWLSRITPLPVKALWLGALRITACAVTAGLMCLVVVRSLSFLAPILQLLAGGFAVAVTYLLMGIAFRRIRQDFKEVLLIGRKAGKG